MSFVGGTAIGRLALGQEVDAAATTTILVAAQGSFAETGEAATFQTREIASQASFTLTGEPASFQVQVAAAAGGGGTGFALTGEAAAFQAQFAAAQGSFALTGEGAVLTPTLTAAAGAFAVTGFAATFETFLASTQWVFSQGALGSSSLGEVALGQADQNRGAFPLTFNYALTGFAAIDLGSERAGTGLFACTGIRADLSYELLGGGGTIVAGTFSRGRWRALQDEIAAAQEAQRKAVAARKRRRREQAQAAARAQRVRVAAARAQAAEADAAAAGQRALADALVVAAGVRRTQDLMRHTVALHALAAAAQAKSRADAHDEDEALALLLAA
jgi:hypothetical protein